jgi:ELWxxDGT repeat protein
MSSMRERRVESLEQRVLMSATLVKDIVSGTTSSFPANLTAVGDQLYFTSATTLWKTDGTTGGTSAVTSVHDLFGNLPISSLASFKGSFFFLSTGGFFSPHTQLWKSDGTEAGTVSIGGSEGTGDEVLVKVGSKLFFEGRDLSNGGELWASDGTSVGTGIVKDINPGTAFSNPLDIVDLNGTALFSADDGIHGKSIWRSNGTAAGTTFIAPTGGFGTPTAVGNQVFFTTKNGSIFDNELWTTNGTAAGTGLVKNIGPSVLGSNPQLLTAFNGKLYFTADDGMKRTLWRSDGTDARTLPVSALKPDKIVAAGTILYLIVGHDLWTMSQSGSLALAKSFSAIGEVAAIGSKLYLGADDGVHGMEPWSTDGTSIGTTFVQDINPGAGGSAPANFTTGGNGVFFTANDGVHGVELWASGIVTPVVLEKHALRVTGTNDADTIGLQLQGSSVVVHHNTKTFSFNLKSVTTIRILVGGGNDYVSVEPGLTNAYVDGGDGNDTIFCGSGNDTLVGGAGRDSLGGGQGNDRISGSDGDDILIGGVGADTLYGENGNDRINGQDQSDRVYGGGGSDVINSGTGGDRLYGEAGNDTIDGGGQDDLIDGGDGGDKLLGGVGDDSMNGAGGSDRLYGQDGNDSISGDAGNDTLDGGAGADKLVGGIGNDQFSAIDGTRDTIDGGAGTDRADDDKVDLVVAIEL